MNRSIFSWLLKCTLYEHTNSRQCFSLFPVFGFQVTIAQTFLNLPWGFELFLWSSMPTVPLLFCAYCSSVPTGPLCLQYLCAHCSSVPTVPLLLCAYCSSVPTGPLFLQYLCAHCSSVPTVPLCPLFLCSPVPTVPLCLLVLCAYSTSVPTVPPGPLCSSTWRHWCVLHRA